MSRYKVSNSINPGCFGPTPTYAKVSQVCHYYGCSKKFTNFFLGRLEFFSCGPEVILICLVSEGFQEFVCKICGKISQRRFQRVTNIIISIPRNACWSKLSSSCTWYCTAKLWLLGHWLPRNRNVVRASYTMLLQL